MLLYTAYDKKGPGEIPALLFFLGEATLLF